MAVITPSGVQLTDFDGKPVVREVQHVTWDPIMAEKGGFKHFMLKEIYEQPRAVRDTTLGRVSLDSGKVFLEEMEITEAELRNVQKINIAACGTSWHAALAGKFMIERLARIPVEVDYASEWRYRDPITSSKEITLLITQSGETADTIAAQREAKAKGSKTLAICNVVGAMIAREASGTVYTHAGPEIGVASTKAFTAQLTALFLLALYLGELRGATSAEEAKKLYRRAAEDSRPSWRHCSAAMKSARPWPNSIIACRTSCSWAAAFTIRLRWKARSSSRKFPTSMLKAIPRAR